LTEDLPIDRHPLRQLAPQRVELAVEACRQLHRVRTRLSLDADYDRRVAVTRAFAALERRAFAHVGNVANEHGPVAVQGDHAVADFLCRSCPADGLKHVLLRPLHVDAGRRVLTRAAHGSEQLAHGDGIGAQLIRMRNDLELTFGTADRRDL
jgi:hypothetical protein